MPHLPRTFTLYLRLACAVAALAAAYACDSRTPTDPAPARMPFPLRGNESGDAELGSISLTPTGSYSQFATIPENAWALVRVSGKWVVESNPACAGQPPNWPCSSLAPYSGYDLEYPDAFRGPVRLATVSATGSFDFLELRGSGGPDEGIGLTQREFSRDVLASPALLNPSVQQFGTTGPSVASYIIDGSYMVTVTRISSPIRVTEGAAEADGSRVYTVEPLYGLKFINPLGSYDPPGAVRWFFVPGEDVDPQAPNSDPPWTINECRNLTSCRWTPPGPGRVQVSASVETRRARARSEPEPPKLVGTLAVACKPDSLLVGNTTTCTASVSPTTSALTVQRWHFAGDSLGVARSRTGDVKMWTFRPTVCGTVSVTGTVDGVEQTATARVEVVCNILRGASRDSLLNDIAVQKVMRQYWAASNPADPNVSNRREQAGYIVRDTATGTLSVVPFSSNTAPNVCFATLDGLDLTNAFQTGHTLVGTFHTHPHNQGRPPPASCHVKGSGLPGARFGDGASDADYAAVNNPSWSVPSYIVDFRHVHRIRPGDTPGTPPHTERRSNNCS